MEVKSRRVKCLLLSPDSFNVRCGTTRHQVVSGLVTERLELIRDGEELP